MANDAARSSYHQPPEFDTQSAPVIVNQSSSSHLFSPTLDNPSSTDLPPHTLNRPRASSSNNIINVSTSRHNSSGSITFAAPNSAVSPSSIANNQSPSITSNQSSSKTKQFVLSGRVTTATDYETSRDDELTLEEKEILAHIQELQIELTQLKAQEAIDKTEEESIDSTSCQINTKASTSIGACGDTTVTSSNTKLDNKPSGSSTTSASAGVTSSPPSRLVVVSYRLPLILAKSSRTGRWKVRRSTGGLDKLGCISGIRRDFQFLWLGYVGQTIPESEQDAVRSLLLRYHCIPVFLTDDQAQNHRSGLSSNVLWPLFHYVPGSITKVGGGKHDDSRYDKQLWLDYQKINQIYANAIHQVYRLGDQIWIHDLDLMLLPSCLRVLIPKCIIGWFLHTPFPSSDVYRRLPVRQELLEGILDADLVGFQTYDYARHFLSSCQLILGVQCSPRGVRVSPRHFVSIGVYPIGIDVGHFVNTAASSGSIYRLEQLRKKFSGKRVLLGVDKLDYIKGMPHKILAMEMLLTRYPEWQHNTVLIQICLSVGSDNETDTTSNSNTSNGSSNTSGNNSSSSSFKQSSSNRELLVQINQMVGRINGAFGTLDYIPIHFINQTSVDADELCALYKLANCCIVTSTRDGMNLVSHEFVVCQQDNQKDVTGYKTGCGVLVLSEFAGSAQSLSGAILINPWNTEDVAAAIHQALTMSRVERDLRQQKLYRYVSTNTSSSWAKSFLEDLSAARDLNLVDSTTPPPRLAVKDVMDAYKSASNRVIITDYDGTLTPMQDVPQLAASGAFLKSIFDTLNDDPSNTVFVVSGKEKKFLEKWLSNVNVGMAAEDGLFYRWRSSDSWETINKYPKEQKDYMDSWKDRVSPVMQSFTERTPGSYIESKQSSLAWHYRDADIVFGPWQAKDLQTTLERVLCGTALEVIQGNHIVEVKHEGCSKSMILDRLLKFLSLPEQVSKRGGEIDFVFCVGDDASDELLFQTLNRLRKEASEQVEEESVDSSTNSTAATKVTVKDVVDTPQPISSSALQAESEDKEACFDTVKYEAIHLKKDAQMFTVHVGDSNESKAAYCLRSLGQLRRILRGFSEISLNRE